ncbi:MAG TPA: acyclic terpene utilization AtuA family protein [Micromonosporaceae bacterium]
MKIMSPTGHLGFTPLEKESFEAGLAERPSAIVADSGSADIGPYPLGADLAHSPTEWQRQDLEHCLLGARKLGVPLVIGSASDTGTDRGVDSYISIIRELAAEHGLAPFRLAAIRSEIEPSRLAAALAQGCVISGLDGRPDADPDTIARTDHVVAVMGVEPIAAALSAGADVVICGRSSDSAIFAAVAESLGGLPRDTALLAGKLLECASFCAEPFMGKETVIGEIDAEGVTVYPMHPAQRCTPASVASHAMYERVDPYAETIPGGRLDMSNLSFQALDERRTRVSGARWIPADTYRVKLEGAGKTGERAVAIMGIRDPYTLSRLDDVIAWSRHKLTERYGSPEQQGYQVYFHTYGRNGVMGALEPTPVVGHEVGIVVEAVAATAEAAEAICALASRNLFYARLPEVKGTAGGASFFSDEVMRARPAYEWTLNHVIALDDGPAAREFARELFRTEFVTVGAEQEVK